MDPNSLLKLLKERGVPDSLTCLLRNQYAGQEASVRTGHRVVDRFKIGKGVCQGYILSPCLFNFYSQYWASQVALMVNNLLANAKDIRDRVSISERRHGNPFQCSCLENPMDRGAWQAIVHAVTKSQTELKHLSMYTCRVPHAKCWAGWIISWNQDCQEKYQ